MPIFDFECKCGHVFERFVWDAEHIPLCNECHGSMVKRIYTVGLMNIKSGYPLWVDRIDDKQKRQEDKGERVTLPHYSEVAY